VSTTQIASVTAEGSLSVPTSVLNRMATTLEGKTGTYAGGASVTAREVSIRNGTCLLRCQYRTDEQCYGDVIRSVNKISYKPPWTSSLYYQISVCLQDCTAIYPAYLIPIYLNSHTICCITLYVDLVERPPVAQPYKNFQICYGTGKFITVFKRATWATCIQSIPHHYIILPHMYE
jgi:hypothetical protein